METNLGIAVVILLLASATVTFFYLLKNSAILPKDKISRTEDEQFFYNFLVFMFFASLIVIAIASLIVYGYCKYVF